VTCAPHRQTRRLGPDGAVDGPHPDAAADTRTLHGSRGTNRGEGWRGFTKKRTRRLVPHGTARPGRLGVSGAGDGVGGTSEGADDAVPNVRRRRQWGPPQYATRVRTWPRRRRRAGGWGSGPAGGPWWARRLTREPRTRGDWLGLVHVLYSMDNLSGTCRCHPFI